MAHDSVFVYQHSIRDEDHGCKVRLFCLKKDGSTAVVKVTDFRPYFYIEVPELITNVTRRKTALITYLTTGKYSLSSDTPEVKQATRIPSCSDDQKSFVLQDKHRLEQGSYKGMMLKLSGSGVYEYKRISEYNPQTNTVFLTYAFSRKKFTTLDSYQISAPFAKALDFQTPPKCTWVHKRHLYFARKRLDENGAFVDEKTEFLKLEFRSLDNMRQVYDLLNKDHNIQMEGVMKKVHLKTHEYEPSITPLVKFFAVSELPSVGWIDVYVPPLDEAEDTFAEYGVTEFKCSYKSLKKSDYEGFVSPKVFTFDIECYSHVYNAMPNYSEISNEVFQISVILSHLGQQESHLFCTGKTNPIDNVKLHMYLTEVDLLKAFFQFIREERPNVILGYNSLGFDIKYILRRCCPPPKKSKETSVYNLRDKVYGLNYFTSVTTECVEKAESWQSSAFGKQDLTFLDIDGVVWIDLYPIIKREFKLMSYKLDAVAEHFLQAHKDPVTPKDIFKSFESKDPAKLSWIGKYCVQDARLTLQLYEKLQVWLGMCEMAKTTKVPLMFLFTKGQQVKIYSQLIDYAHHNDYVIESNVVNYEDISYKGATVYAPEPGMYHNVLAFDFASLYPSIIISHNIDYTTLVRDDDQSIPDELCHVFEWSEHENCEHDPQRPERVRKSDKVYCGDFKYRFLKHEHFGHGIIPTIIAAQLDARKKTRKELAHVKQRLEEEKLEDEERAFLTLKADVLEERQKSYKINANSMYGVLGARKGYLPMLPAAMSVTYVGRQSIKKASSYIVREHAGEILYGDTDSCFCTFPIDDLKVLSELAQKISADTQKLFPAPMKLEYEGKIYKDFFILSKKRYAARACDENGKVSDKIMKKGVQTQRRDSTKLLKSIYDKAIEKIMDSEGYQTLLEYMSENIKKMFTRQYEDKYYSITKSLAKEEYKSNPPQMIVAERMKRRGKQVPTGSRIDYVITTMGGYKAGQKDKIEEWAYFAAYREAFALDYLYYVEHQLANPLGEIMEKAFRNAAGYHPKPVEKLYEYHKNYFLVVQRLKDIFQTKVEFE